MSLESEQMLGRATVGKSKNPVRITRKREKHPQAGWRPALSGPGTGPHENGSGTSRLLQSSEHLAWSPSLGEESRGRAELYPRDLHWATGSSPTDPITLQRCRSHWELLVFRLQAVFITWNVLFQLPVSAWPIPQPWEFGVGPPLPGSLHGLGVLTLISRVLGSSLP